MECTADYYIECVNALMTGFTDGVGDAEMSEIRAGCLSLIPGEYDWTTWCTFTIHMQFHKVFFEMYDDLLRSQCKGDSDGEGQGRELELKLCVMRLCATHRQMVSILRTLSARIQYISKYAECINRKTRMTNALNSLMSQISSRATSRRPMIHEIVTFAEKQFTGEILHGYSGTFYYDCLSQWSRV